MAKIIELDVAPWDTTNETNKEPPIIELDTAPWEAVPEATPVPRPETPIPLPTAQELGLGGVPAYPSLEFIGRQEPAMEEPYLALKPEATPEAKAIQNLVSTDPIAAVKLASNPSRAAFETLLPGNRYSKSQREEIAGMAKRAIEAQGIFKKGEYTGVDKNIQPYGGEIQLSKKQLADLPGIEARRKQGTFVENVSKAKDIIMGGTYGVGAQVAALPSYLDAVASEFFQTPEKGYNPAEYPELLNLKTLTDGELVIKDDGKIYERIVDNDGNDKYLHRSDLDERAPYISRELNKFSADTATRLAKDVPLQTSKVLRDHASAYLNRVTEGRSPTETFAKEGITEGSKVLMAHIFNQVPQLLVTFGIARTLGPQAALEAMALGSAADKYAVLRETRPDMSRTGAVINSYLTGQFEKIGEGSGTMKNLNKYILSNKKEIAKGFGRAAMEMGIIAPVTEAKGELITKWGQDFTDLITGNTDKNIKDMSFGEIIEYMSKGSADTALIAAGMGGGIAGIGSFRASGTMTPEQKQAQRVQIVDALAKRKAARSEIRRAEEFSLAQKPTAAESDFNKVGIDTSPKQLTEIADKYGIDTTDKSEQQIQDEITTAETRPMLIEQLGQMSDEELDKLATEYDLETRDRGKLLPALAEEKFREQVQERRLENLNSREQESLQNDAVPFEIAELSDKSLSVNDKAELNDLVKNLTEYVETTPKSGLVELAVDMGVSPKQLVGKLRKNLIEQAKKAYILDASFAAHEDSSKAVQVLAGVSMVLPKVETVQKSNTPIAEPILSEKVIEENTYAERTGRKIKEGSEEEGLGQEEDGSLRLRDTSENGMGAEVLRAKKGNSSTTLPLADIATKLGISTEFLNQKLPVENAVNLEDQTQSLAQRQQISPSITQQAMYVDQTIKNLREGHKTKDNDARLMGVELFKKDPMKYRNLLISGQFNVPTTDTVDTPDSMQKAADLIAVRMALDVLMRDPNATDAERIIGEAQYSRAGSEASTALRLRQNISPTAAAIQSLTKIMYDLGNSSLSSKAKDKLNKALREGKDVSAIKAEIDEYLSTTVEKVKEALRKAGLHDDISQFTDDELRDVNYTIPWIHTVSAARAVFLDKVEEARIANLLYSVATHTVNITGSIALGMHEYGIVRPSAALMGESVRLIKALTNGGKVPSEYKNLPRIAELPALYGGMVASLGDAFKAAKFAFKYEIPVTVIDGGIKEYTLNEGRDVGFNRSMVESSRVAIGGKLGRIIRLDLRALLAMDEFAKTIFRAGELNANAINSGMANGFKPGSQEMKAHIENILNNPVGTWEYDAAVDSAKRATLQQELGTLGQLVMKLRRVPYFGRIFKIIVPMYKTLHNLSKLVAMSTLPGGAFDVYRGSSTLSKIKICAENPGQVREAANQVIRGVSAMGLFALMASMMGDDEEGDPAVTGYAPEGRTPRGSIKKFGQYWNYSQIPIFGQTMMANVALMETLKDMAVGKKGTDKLFDDNVKRAADAAESIPLAQGIIDLHDLFQNETSAIKYFARLGATYFPLRAISSYARLADPHKRDMRIINNSKTFKEDAINFSKVFWYSAFPAPDLNIIKNGLYKCPFAPKVDQYGQYVYQGNPSQPWTTNLPMRLFFGSSYSSSNDRYTHIDRFITDWNDNNWDSEKDRISEDFAPPSSFTYKKKEYKLDEETTQLWLKTRGEKYSEILNEYEKELKFKYGDNDELNRVNASRIKEAQANAKKYANGVVVQFETSKKEK